MCKRKIINKENVYIVPLLNGCECPMIKEIRNVNGEPIKIRKNYTLKHCYDVHTNIPASVQGMHIVFRMCKCKYFSGQCMNLPPMFYTEIESELDEESDRDDDDSDEENWGIGSGGMPIHNP